MMSLTFVDVIIRMDSLCVPLCFPLCPFVVNELMH